MKPRDILLKSPRGTCWRVFRTHLGRGWILIVALVIISGSGGLTPGTGAAAFNHAPINHHASAKRSYQRRQALNTSPFMFGVINDNGAHYDDEWARGVRATTLELQWKLYEPQENIYDAAYINHLKGILRNLKAQGWYVQLIPGIHYTPDWVFTNYPDMFYVNQYGENYNPDPVTQGDFQVINAPFNPEARALIRDYITRIFQDFDQADPGLRFDSVRVGGGLQGELRYPPGNWNGHTNAFWSFDSHAQDPTKSGIPNEVIGWRPGIDPNPGSLGYGQRLVNPGFEESYPYYPILAWSPDDEVIAQRTALDPHGGNFALSLTLNSPHRIHQYVRVEPNETYVFGGWFKSANGTGRARLLLNQYDAEGNEIPGAPFGKLESLDTAWVLRSGTLMTASTTQYLKVALDGDQTGIYYFDELWLKLEGETDQRARNINLPIAFYDWYVGSLSNYQNWQIDAFRQYFDGQLDLVYAGKGLLPKQIMAALTNDLNGDGWSESSRALYSGATYDRHVNNLNTKANIALYLTGVEVPPSAEANDQSPYPSDWSAARWIAYLAQEHGLPIWGENSGQNDRDELDVAAARMHANTFFGLMWGFESELYANPNPNGYATISDYQAIIERYTNLNWLYLPLFLTP